MTEVRCVQRTAPRKRRWFAARWRTIRGAADRFRSRKRPRGHRVRPSRDERSGHPDGGPQDRPAGTRGSCEPGIRPSRPFSCSHLRDHESHSATSMRATVASGGSSPLDGSSKASPAITGSTFIHHAHDRRAAIVCAVSAAGLWPMWRARWRRCATCGSTARARLLTVIGAGAIGEWSEARRWHFCYLLHRIEA